MLKSDGLAFRVPVLAGALLTLAGCFTLLRHPETDVAADHGADYGDCASCHAGFAEPVYSDPYGHYSDLWWDYYGCPWWVSDCGPAVYPASGGTGGSGGAEATEGRFIGNRGGAVAGFRTPPPISPPAAPGLASPGASAPASSAPAPAGDDSNGRKKKKTRDDPAGDKDADRKSRDDGKDEPEEADPPREE